MPRPAKQDGHDGFGRHRMNKRRKGMRLLRIWVPDPLAPGFRAEARRRPWTPGAREKLNDANRCAALNFWPL